MAFKKPSLAPYLAFFQLLFYANPTWLDGLLILTGAIFAIAAGVPFPLIGIVFGQLVDDINDATCSNRDGTGANQDMSSINSKVLLLVYIAIASFACIYIHLVCWNIASQRLAQRIRDRYLRNLLRQDLAFFDNLQSGEVSSRLNGDISAIEGGTGEKVGVALTCLSFCVTAYIVGFIKNAELAGMLVSLIPAFLLMAVIGGHYVGKYTVSLGGYFGSASALASEALSNVGLVHALGANDRLEKKFRDHLGNARHAGIRKALAAAVMAGLLYFIAFSASALGYWQGSKRIADTIDGRGSDTIGEIYTVTFILLDGMYQCQFTQAFTDMAQVLSCSVRLLPCSHSSVVQSAPSLVYARTSRRNRLLIILPRLRRSLLTWKASLLSAMSSSLILLAQTILF